MKLKITDVNLTVRNNWLFKLADEKNNEFYVMDEAFYKSNDLKAPIARMEMDYYNKGQQVTADTRTIGNKEVVLDFK